jgi:hypothetical protein
MILWIKKEGIPGYACDQRAEVLEVVEDTENGDLPQRMPLLKVKMCGTGEILEIHPRFAAGVEVAPCLTVLFRVNRLQSDRTNGELTR